MGGIICPPPPDVVILRPPPVRVLIRHRLGYWCGAPMSAWGGGLSRPLLSRERLVVKSRAWRNWKSLHKTLPKHLSGLKIDVTCEVKIRSKVKIWR